MTLIEISKTIKRRRKELGITQFDLAKTVGTNRYTIGQLESGECFPNTVLLLAIIRALGMSLDIIDE